MDINKHTLKDGHVLKIREAVVDDAPELLDFIHGISAESDFLTFGPGEFEIGEQEEKEYIQKQFNSENNIFLLATIDKKIVVMLNFNARYRPRVRHSGEFNMVVKKHLWGLGIGSHLLDTLIEWGHSTQIIKKINLRVRTDNYNAIRLYKQKGFVNEGTIRKEIFLDDKYYDLLWMGLEL